MGLLDGNFALQAHAPDADRKAAEALDALVLRQMLSASGAFKGKGLAGSSLHADLFVDALADAVARSGGLGLGAAALPSARQADDAAAARSVAIARDPTTALADRWSHPAATAPADAFDGGGLELSAPVATARATSGYGVRKDPIAGGERLHRGVDLAAPEGELVVAAASGVVVRAGSRGGYGQAVEIDHGGGVTTLYAHASSLLVREGDEVQARTPIATVGNTGRSTGAHLHFELRMGGRAIDPRSALKACSERADETSEKGSGGRPP
jgi:murein DD-endopeptidase MepM/ murein hydrolase activator NlpD